MNNRMGFHWTACDTGHGSSSGALWPYVAGVAGGLVALRVAVAALAWVGNTAAVGARAVAPFLLPTAGVLLAVTVAFGWWAVTSSRRRPEHQWNDPPRYRSASELQQTEARPVAPTGALTVEQARDLAQLVAVTAARPMPTSTELERRGQET